MKKGILALTIVAGLATGLEALATPDSNDVRPVCAEGELQIIFPALHYRTGMVYPKSISFDYETQTLAIEVKPGPDKCHVLGRCKSYVHIPYNFGNWKLEVDGKEQGSVNFAIDSEPGKKIREKTCTHQR